MTWPLLLDRIFRAAVVLGVFGFTAWLVAFHNVTDWMFVAAFAVCSLALGWGDK